MTDLELLQEYWEDLKKKIKHEFSITDIAFNTWIDPLKLHSFSRGEVLIVVPKELDRMLKFYNDNYKTLFMVAITEYLNKEDPVIISFITSESVNDTLLSNDNAETKKSGNDSLNKHFTFDTFVVGNNNRLVHAAALAVSESPGSVYNPLYIYGDSGLGKTHLMHAIGNHIFNNNNNMKVLYVNSEEFTNEVVNCIRSNNNVKINEMREKFRGVDVLLIDDIQFIMGKERTQEEFFYTFNALHSAGKAIILSSDINPKKMTELEERYRSRFVQGFVCDIQAPDYETRLAILYKTAENSASKFKVVDPDYERKILEHIASHIKSNIRELQGAFNKYLAYSKINLGDNGEPHVLTDAELKDVTSSSMSKEITPEIIIEAVADFYHIRSEEIMSPKRNKEFSWPRQVAMYLCRELTDETLQKIATVLHKKDHTTIISGVNNVKNAIQKDADLSKKVDDIKRKIRL